MNVRPVLLVGASLWLCLVSAATWAVDGGESFTDPAERARYEAITRELRCLVCQNQTIADSDADLAKDLRREVRSMMQAGQTDDQIRTFMTDRYGDFVLYRPRTSGRTFILWAAPALLLIGGLAVTGLVIRRRARALADAPPDPDDSLAHDDSMDRKA